ncbi:MAG: uracil phosphoribosyltransferase [Bacteroidetes bacterium]|nr:uracil phosphoribosyltransferase [Bacteroidota bacterium]
MVYILNNSDSVLNQFMSEIRDVEVQGDPLRFRYNMVRIGEIFAYEISKKLPYETKEVSTTLGIANVPVLVQYPVLATILRAGLPFHQGFLNFFDKSENAFISAYRKTHKDRSFSMNIGYASMPEVEGKIIILCDVMIATGSSMVMAYKELIAKGKPLHTHIVSIVASMEGLHNLKKYLPNDETTIWLGGVDDELTAQAFIVPGLGDAGDLAYGKKI